MKYRQEKTQVRFAYVMMHTPRSSLLAQARGSILCRDTTVVSR
jgi:hypothetical protein